MEAKIRKLENNLVTLGTGIFILSLWTLFKTVLFDIVNWGEIKNASKSLPPMVSSLVIGAVYVALIIEFLLHSYIGLSARSEGQGKKKTPVYLFVTGFIIILYSAIILLELLTLFLFREHFLTLAVSMVIDATVLFFMIDMTFSSVRLRKLKKQRAEKEESTV